MDLFLLKKMISAAIMPVSILLILLLLAIVFHHKKPKFSFKCLCASFLLLFFSTFPPIADWLMRPIENDFPILTNVAKPISYIVVLGGYNSKDDSIPATNRLSNDSIQRLVEGVRLMRLHPEATLITSGSAFEAEQSHAQVVKEAAMLLGIPEHKIITENFPKDTEEEAQLIAPRIAGTRSILVTNADSMPRAMTYFKRYGASPIAAPVDPWVRINRQPATWSDFIPSSKKLQQTTVAWYETLGRIVQWFKGLMS